MRKKRGTMKRNPWLNIPASDYEGHMGLPEVNQLSFLGEVFRAMKFYKIDRSGIQGQLGLSDDVPL